MNVTSERWVFQNAITSPANGNALFYGRWDQVTVYITGTATSHTTVFEGSDKDGNWYLLPAIKLPEGTSASQTTGINEAWVIDLSPWFSVRTRVSVVSGGNVTITGKVIDSTGM